MKLGSAFSDNISIERSRILHLHDPKPQEWWLGSGRALIFTTIFVIIFFLLMIRLFDLTVIHGYSYRSLADGNRTRDLIRHAPRGIIYDRTGLPLVQNNALYRKYSPCTDDPTRLCVTKISEDAGKQLQIEGMDPGTFVEKDYSRQYTHPESTAQVVGYIGQVSDTELNDSYYQIRGYVQGDSIGRSGVEQVFEEKLRGQDGREFVEVDAGGKILRVLAQNSEQQGQDITLSLDSQLSDVVADSFPEDKNGAVIVSKPHTGEILALYSSPTFSLNAFAVGLTQSAYDALADDPRQPLFNRAIAGVYPPGSTFKIVSSTAALEEKSITRDTQFEDTGKITIGPFSFSNWYFTQYGKTDGMVDIVKGIQRSNDIFFYKLGEAVGITKLAAWARRMGLGSTLGIELAGEASGLMPDPNWKAQTFSTDADITAKNNEWYLGDTYHVAIGQGYVLTTPLQVNAWTNIIANGGKICRPTILKTESGKPKAEGRLLKTDACKDLKISKETIQLVTEGMKRACEPGGTASTFFNFGISKLHSDTPESSGSGTFIPISVACKTGTAEVGFGGSNQPKTHAWFTAFAPLPAEDSAKDELSEKASLSGDPEISVTVLVENAGEGSEVAAPIAKKILEEWFGR